jgi:hypothetical protein
MSSAARATMPGAGFGTRSAAPDLHGSLRVAGRLHSRADLMVPPDKVLRHDR